MAEYLADDLAKNSPLTEKQARVYTARVVNRESREEAMAKAGVSVSAVDDRLRRARDKMGDVFDLLSLIGREGLVPVRRSNSKTWHRIDAQGCDYAWGVFPNAPYEERLVRAEDLDQLMGELCADCFPGLNDE